MIIEEGCEILNARCEIYDDATRGEKYSVLTNVDARVEIHIGCIKLIFVNTFFNDILVSFFFFLPMGLVAYLSIDVKIQ